MMELTYKIRDIRDGSPEMAPRVRVQLDRTFLKDALGSDVDLDRSHATATFGIGRSGDTIHVRGRLEGEVVTSCVRCLREAHVPVDVPLNVFLASEELAEGEEVEEEISGDISTEDASEIEFYTHDGLVIDLATVVREALILAMPMNLTCRESCAGLCSICGAPRGEDGRKTCECPDKPVDPRWAGLKEIKL